MVTVEISQNGQLKQTYKDQESDFCALKYLLGHQPHSTDHALRYEGWEVKVTDQDTQEVYFWKPYTKNASHE